MNKSVLFAVPTLFTDPKNVNECVRSLYDNLNNSDIDYKICVIINEPSKAFDDYTFDCPVEKMCGHLQFNISRALNTAYSNNLNYDYFCFFDEGIRISNSQWLDFIIKFFESRENVGLIGCRPHTAFNHYHKMIMDDPMLYEVLWSDGILFTKMSLLKKFNGFDESYFAECELQDFGYRLHISGYTNYYWRNLADSHKLTKFEKKHTDKNAILRARKNSRRIFHDKWVEFERSYNFQTITELT